MPEWIEPVTDRTQADVDEAIYYVKSHMGESGALETKKGCLNYTDLNRMENNVGIVSDMLDVSVNTKTWTNFGIPTSSDESRLLLNLDSIITEARKRIAGVTLECPDALSTFTDFNLYEETLRLIYENLPDSPYTTISFIQSTNRQTINTGYIPNENTRIEGTFMLFSNYTQSSYITQALFGAYDNFYLRNTYSGTNLTSTFKCGSQTITQPILTPYSEKIRIVADVNGVTVYDIDGTVLGSISVSGGTISTSYPIFIFSKNSPNQEDSYADGRIYGFKIYENDVLVRDFVPAKRNNDGACGLLEQLSGDFFTDANPQYTGFYSDDFDENYSVLESVETSGNLYVDTHYIHKTNTRITIDSVPDISGSDVTALDSCLFGSNYNMQYGSDYWVIWIRTLLPGGVPAFRRGAEISKYADCSAMNFRTRSTLVAENLTMTMTYPDSTSVTVTQTDGEINSGINSMYLFWENISPDTGLTYQKSYTRFYSAQISEVTNGEGTLVRDLIPVKRKGDNIITLYDRVTTAEFGGMGGSFTEVV